MSILKRIKTDQRMDLLTELESIQVRGGNYTNSRQSDGKCKYTVCPDGYCPNDYCPKGYCPVYNDPSSSACGSPSGGGTHSLSGNI